jgi:hypothetical protein
MALDIAQCRDEREKLEWAFRYLLVAVFRQFKISYKNIFAYVN